MISGDWSSDVCSSDLSQSTARSQGPFAWSPMMSRLAAARLAANRDIMGDQANGPWLRAVLWLTIVAVLILTALLLLSSVVLPLFSIHPGE